MAQQVNLCLPVLRKQKSRFAAQTLAQALAVLLLVGAALSAVWVSNLNQAGASLTAILAAQSKELEGLRTALEQSKQSSGPAELALAQEVKASRAALQQREKVLAALSQGLVQPGYGHAARLQLVARSIPPVAWITAIKADERRLEVGGYTLEPAALNDWVNQLASSPLLRGQALSTIKVESVKPESVVNPVAGGAAVSGVKPPASAAAAAVASAPVAVMPPVWSFMLQSSLADAKTLDKVVAGGKP